MINNRSEDFSQKKKYGGEGAAIAAAGLSLLHPSQEGKEAANVEEGEGGGATVAGGLPGANPKDLEDEPGSQPPCVGRRPHRSTPRCGQRGTPT
jgi:hypothetical protein